MALICPPFALTWYPGAWPSEASPLALQSADHLCEEKGNSYPSGHDLAVQETVLAAAGMAG